MGECRRGRDSDCKNFIATATKINIVITITIIIIIIIIIINKLS